MITLNSVIGEQWTSPQDEIIKKMFEQIQIQSFDLVSPFSYATVDTFINEIETHLNSRNLQLTQESINFAFSELNWFTQYQINLWDFLNFYTNISRKYKTVIEYLNEIRRQNFENDIQAKIKNIYTSKNKELIELEKSYFWKKLSTSENKFLNSKIQIIEDKYSSQLLMYTWPKLNNTIFSMLKKDKTLLELNRKFLIIEKIVGYLDYRYKSFNEQIRSYKKIIENLVFLNQNLTNWNV